MCTEVWPPYLFLSSEYLFVYELSIFYPLVSLKLGNCLRIKFWEDVWRGTKWFDDSPVYEFFSREHSSWDFHLR